MRRDVTPDLGPLHIVSTRDMERATGIAAPAAGAPVLEELAWKFRARHEDLVAFCGYLVSVGGVPRGEAVTPRALKADPIRFQRERICAPCRAALRAQGDA